jgi:hypothetical protein
MRGLELQTMAKGGRQTAQEHQKIFTISLDGSSEAATVYPRMITSTHPG